MTAISLNQPLLPIILQAHKLCRNRHQRDRDTFGGSPKAILCRGLASFGVSVDTKCTGRAYGRGPAPEFGFLTAVICHPIAYPVPG